MLEYRSVVWVFPWQGRGAITQKIGNLIVNGEEQPEWEGSLWVDYLNESAREGWELVTVSLLSDGVLLVHFKREI